MPKVPIPGTGQEVDPTDPVGTASTFSMVAIGVAMAIGAFAVGQWLYNSAVGATGAVDDRVEVL